MKIIKLSANNIKKLKAIEITPKGDIVIISGKNGQGKTNVLESIWYALAGSKDIPTEPIRKGEKEGDIKLDLGEYIVTRKFTKSGENTYLEVKNKEGAKFPSPQALLDKLIGDVSFNPIDLMRANNRDQMLLDIAGLSVELEKLENKRGEIYSQRTFENKEVKKLEAQIDKYIEKAESVDIQELIELERSIRGNNETIDKVECNIETFKENIKEANTEIDKLKERVFVTLQPRIERLKGNIEKSNTELTVLREKKERLPKLEVIKKDIKEAEEKNQRARDFQENEKIKAEHKKRESIAIGHTETIERIDKEKKSLIENAKFPVKGMGYRDGKVVYKDIPLDQLSKSEEVLLGIWIQINLHPELKVILIPDASLLDSENMKIIEKLAKTKNYQIWIERVDDTGEVGIYIEDGMITNKKGGR